MTVVFEKDGINVKKRRGFAMKKSGDGDGGIRPIAMSFTALRHVP